MNVVTGTMGMDTQGKRDLRVYETLLAEITSSEKLNKA